MKFSRIVHTAECLSKQTTKRLPCLQWNAR